MRWRDVFTTIVIIFFNILLFSPLVFILYSVINAENIQVSGEVPNCEIIEKHGDNYQILIRN